MATVVPCASCYGSRSVQPLQLFGKSPNSSYMSLLTHRNPRGGPRPRLACHGPKLTLRQICRMLRMMRQVRNREAAATTAGATRMQGVPLSTPGPPPAPPPGKPTSRRCLPSCLRRRRNASLKRVG